MLARVAVVGDPPVGDAAGWLAWWYDAGQLGAVASAPPPGDGPVLVLGERRFQAQIGREAALLADALHVGVARRLLPHGPLAVRYLAEVAAGHWAIGPARAVEVLDRVAPGTFSAAWVPRVGRLSSPVPTLAQHARSWLPVGGGFMAEHVPGNRVYRTRQPSDATGPARGPLLVAGELPDPVRAAAAVSAGAQEAYRVEPVVAPRARYGTDRAVEMVALPADVPALAATHQAGHPCQVCGLSHAAQTCPFCHAGAVPLGARGDT